MDCGEYRGPHQGQGGHKQFEADDVAQRTRSPLDRGLIHVNILTHKTV
jgi:hypothetical protein